MATTIQITKKLQKELSERKLSRRESYEQIIWDLIEDTKELNEQTKKEIKKARAEIKAGKFYTFSQVKDELDV